MYAILKCGGKQLKVQKGDKVSIERVMSEVGETITLGLAESATCTLTNELID